MWTEAGRRAGQCRAAVAAVALAAASSCTRDPAGLGGSFRETTLEAGLALTSSYPDGAYYLPEITGSGVALLDADGDADLDVYQSVHPPPARPWQRQLDAPAPNRWYRQETGGRLAAMAAEAGGADPGYGQGVAVGDADNDGRPDLYLANFGHSRLLLNRGGVFEDATGACGLGDPPARRWTSAAAFLDHDQDGHLDLFAVSYVDLDADLVCTGEGGRPDYCGPLRFPGAPSVLHRNRGGGVFDDVTARAGVGAPGRGLGAACADFTGDGRADIYVANDREANRLWVGRDGGTFEDEALARGVALSGAGEVESSMGVAAGDVDGNGEIDILVTNLTGETNTLYLSQRGGQFADRSASSGLSAADILFTGWGCVFFDLECDGDLDLATANGRIARGRTEAEGAPAARLGRFWREYSERNLLFINDGAGRFESAESGAGDFTREADNWRGLAAGDIDGDGAVDLVATTTDNSLRIFRNQSACKGRWLGLRVLCGARPALGARVTIALAGAAGAPARPLVRVVMAAQSYASSSDPTVHVGLGAANRVAGVEVTWPDGARERFDGAAGAVDRVVTLRQGEGTQH